MNPEENNNKQQDIVVSLGSSYCHGDAAITIAPNECVCEGLVLHFVNFR